jgi:hypothetical protein
MKFTTNLLFLQLKYVYNIPLTTESKYPELATEVKGLGRDKWRGPFGEAAVYAHPAQRAP